MMMTKWLFIPRGGRIIIPGNYFSITYSGFYSFFKKNFIVVIFIQMLFFYNYNHLLINLCIFTKLVSNFFFLSRLIHLYVFFFFFVYTLLYRLSRSGENSSSSSSWSTFAESNYHVTTLLGILTSLSLYIYITSNIPPILFYFIKFFFST